MTVSMVSRYRLRGTVEAVLVTTENVAEVAEWCGGEVLPDDGNGNRGASRPAVTVVSDPQLSSRREIAIPGDYLVRFVGSITHDVSFKAVRRALFERDYEPVTA